MADTHFMLTGRGAKVPIRLKDLGDGTWGISVDGELTQGAPGAEAWPISYGADARNGALASLEITLSVTPGTVTVVTLPDTARGFRIYARSNACRFAVGESPATVGTVATGDQVVAAADFAVGGIAKADAWETRLLEAGTARTLGISSATASTVLDLEVF